MTAGTDIAELVARARQNRAPLSAWAADFLASMERRTDPLTDRQRDTLRSIADRPDCGDVARRLAERMGDLARDLAGEPSHKGRNEWRFGSHGSLSAMVAGPKRGAWHDHEAGIGGDALALIAHRRHMTTRDALAWALAWLGDAPHHDDRPQSAPAVRPPEAPREACPSATLDLAWRIWREAVEPAGTPVESYLAARGLALPAAAPLRFHPDCPRGAERWPAMLALMTDPASGEACGVHRTFIARDGSGKAPGPMAAKMMCGNAGVIRLVPDEDVALGLGIAEGVETALAVMQRAGWSPVWAATSAGAVKRFPVQPGIEALTIFADMDGAGLEAARECGRRWAAAGREARLLAPPAGDWDDVLRHGERAA